jgi:hypothetical protein
MQKGNKIKNLKKEKTKVAQKESEISEKKINIQKKYK